GGREMLRALWFAVRLGLLVAAAIWVANRPGEVEVHWLGYDIKTEVGMALLALFLALLVCLFVYRVLTEIVKFPASWRRYREHNKRNKGFRALTLGLTAVAAGDAKMAGYHAHRARQFLKHDNGLTVLLEAQAARLKGSDTAAR